MKKLAMIALLGCIDAPCADVRSLTASEVQDAIRRLPVKPPTNAEVLTEDYYAIKVAVVENRVGPAEIHQKEDRVFYVLDGSAELRIGGTVKGSREISAGELQGKEMEGFRTIAMKPGTVISVPRGVGYQLAAEHSRVSFLVVRIKGQ
jgi:mannose-6-phosphate isomerase-like protein (cupin superfamily)